MWTDEKIERVIDEAAERAASKYYPKTKEMLDLILATLEAVQVTLGSSTSNA